MSDPAPAANPAPRSDRDRQIALYVLCVGMLMIILDSTIVNVALPSIQADLGFSQSTLAWVVNAYLIPFGGLLLLAGRLGDLVGRKRLFIAGLAVFIAASALCGIAPTQEFLIASRFLQGVGGALTSAVILGMIVTMFPGRREQAKAIGVYSFVAASGASLGLLAGGALTETISWHWIFYVNLPFGLVAIYLASKLIETDAGIGIRKGADAPGAVLVTAGLMLLVYTIVEAVGQGWGSARTLGMGAIALLLLAGFVARQATARVPLMRLGVLRSRNVWGANLIQILMVGGLFAMFFLGALYLQQVLGYSPLEVGLAFLPVAVLIGLVSLKGAGVVMERVGMRAALLAGLGLVLIGLLWFSRLPVDGAYVADVLPAMVLLGLGAGLSFPALVSLAMGVADPADAGVASGLVNTTQQVGGALGLSILVSLSTGRTHAALETASSHASALVSGYRLAFLIAAGFVAAGIALAALVVREPADGAAASGEPEPEVAAELAAAA